MAHGLMTWTGNGKLQMTSERLTRLYAVYTIRMGNGQTYPSTHSQPVSGMVNDGTWFALASTSPVESPPGSGNWIQGNISDAKITIFTGSFYVEWGWSNTDVIIEVIRV